MALIASLGSGLLAACQNPGANAPSGEGPVVRIGYSAWPGWFPWAVTEAKGLFAKAGVNGQMQWFDGYLDSINALNAGQLDCNSQTLNDTISSVAGGADLQVVLQNDYSTGNDQIIVAEGINSVADLKGKKVAAEEGTVDHYLLLKVLKDNGLQVSDITFVPLETGAAAAAFAASPLLRQALGEELHGSLVDSHAAELQRAAGLSEQELVAASCWWPLVGGQSG